jgi:hypothetical protein
LLGNLYAAADSWVDPSPFEIYSKDKSKVFRFEPNRDNEFEGVAKAALYDASNTGKIIYQVNNLRSHASKSDFFFSEDFQNFAFFPPADFEIAFQLYLNGEIIKTYYIKELVKKHDKIFYSTSAAWWRKDDSRPSQQGNILTFTTVDNLTYHFDIVAGDFVTEPESANTFQDYIRRAAPFIAVFICVSGLVIYFIISRQRKTEADI